MIVRPVFITGPPRSGTSMLFHIMRTTLPFWSLPSEGEEIWKTACHPERNNWISEECHEPETVAEDDKRQIRALYEKHAMPSVFWRHLVRPETVWQSGRSGDGKLARSLNASLYHQTVSLFYYLNPFRERLQRRILDKSVDNCLRLELIWSIFPECKFIFIHRNGLETVRSMIAGWLNPNRFTKYTLPEELDIMAYPGSGWSFILPEGWRDMNGRHLAEVCAWQWCQCIDRILVFEKTHPDIILRLKLEDLLADPAGQLETLARFVDVSPDSFNSCVQNGIPVINAAPSEVNKGFPFPDQLEKVNDLLVPYMKDLKYD